MGVRRKGRELALQLLYESEFNKKDLDERLNSFRERHDGMETVKDFVCELVKGSLSNVSRIDKVLSACSSNWHRDRMTAIDRNVLRMGTYELLFSETPPAVVIDEAVEIARKFGTEKSPGFVNGVLDCIRKKSREGKLGRDSHSSESG